MKNYDFHHLLEPVEFQEFARDIIQVREKIRLEAFREGPDQGMDARCITPDGKCIVMQAKRWANESALRWKELREEKKKADRIKLTLDNDTFENTEKSRFFERRTSRVLYYKLNTTQKRRFSLSTWENRNAAFFMPFVTQ